MIHLLVIQRVPHKRFQGSNLQTLTISIIIIEEREAEFHFLGNHIHHIHHKSLKIRGALNFPTRTHLLLKVLLNLILKIQPLAHQNTIQNLYHYHPILTFHLPVPNQKIYQMKLFLIQRLLQILNFLQNLYQKYQTFLKNPLSYQNLLFLKNQIPLQNLIFLQNHKPILIQLHLYLKNLLLIFKIVKYVKLKYFFQKIFIYLFI